MEAEAAQMRGRTADDFDWSSLLALKTNPLRAVLIALVIWFVWWTW